MATAWENHEASTVPQLVQSCSKESDMVLNFQILIFNFDFLINLYLFEVIQ